MADSPHKDGVKHSRPQWMGRDIADEHDGEHLERESALKEFSGKMHRGAAEDEAYGDYRKQQHAIAAAHHLTGMKLAEAAGDLKQGRKHGLMYELHLKALGHESVGPVPDEVHHHLRDNLPEKLYRFKPHPGDAFVLDSGNLGKQENSMADEKLNWEKHDDDSGGFLEAFNKSDRSTFRTWAVPMGGKGTKHVLVKTESGRQSPLGYFESRDEALSKAEELSKDGPRLDAMPMNRLNASEVKKDSGNGVGGGGDMMALKEQPIEKAEVCKKCMHMHKSGDACMGKAPKGVKKSEEDVWAAVKDLNKTLEDQHDITENLKALHGTLVKLLPESK
jgi:hypothetical protein